MKTNNTDYPFITSYNPYDNLNASEVEREALATGNHLALRALDLTEEAVEEYIGENGSPDYWRSMGETWVLEVSGDSWYEELIDLIQELEKAETKSERESLTDDLIMFIGNQQDRVHDLCSSILSGGAD